MIRQIYEWEYNILDRFLLKDIGRNYFLLLGLRKDGVYSHIYGEFEEAKLKAVLLLRKSGILQFYASEEFDLQGFVEIIRGLDYKSMIGPKSFCHEFLNMGVFNGFTEGAYLSKLDKDHRLSTNINKHAIMHISVEDLDSVVELYEEVFKSFASKEIMENKIKQKRGRGVMIKLHGKVASVAQSDFEIKDGALIVGVATAKEYRGQGLGTDCLTYLCNILQQEGKDLFIQYDNMEAEGIYSRLGFKKFDQVMHYFK